MTNHRFLAVCILCLTAFLSAWASKGHEPTTAVTHAFQTGAWPTYNGDYSGRRFSPLNRVNASNVRSLSLAWMFRTNSMAIKATPLMANGILYFSVPDHVWAVDARTGRQIWHYTWKTRGGIHIGNRGVGIFGPWLYFVTPDNHLVCLNTKDGTERWHVEIADVKLEYFSTMAPLVIRNHVIVGVGGDSLDVPGYLDSYDPETGKRQWRWYTHPEPGEAEAATWPDTEAMRHGGGMTWITGTYDPQLNLIYWGTGNPNPVMAGQGRTGDNLWTCSVVALNPDAGKLAWYFQPSPHDVHDWDCVETPVLIDGEFLGSQRKMVAQASRNGYFFLLDRINGQHLLTAPFVDTLNWASGIDAKGKPIGNPRKDPQPDGSLVSPSSDGATNWWPPAYMPTTGLFYVNAARSYSVFYLTDTSQKPQGWGGRDYTVWSEGMIQAIDYRTGKIRWTHETGPRNGAGLLGTAGKLLFAGDGSGNFLALDPAKGRTLWHANVGAVVTNGPMTYEVDGRQYVVVAADDMLYAFVLFR